MRPRTLLLVPVVFVPVLLLAACSAAPATDETMTEAPAQSIADAGVAESGAVEAADESLAPVEEEEESEHTCGGDFEDSDEAEAVPAVEAPREARAGDLLVWVRSREGETTLRLDRESGEVVGSAPGIVIASGRETWTLRTEEKTYALPSCREILRDLGGEAEAAGDEAGDDELRGGRATRLVAAADGHETEIVGFDVATAADGVAQNVQHASVVGSVGPYLFIHRTNDVYACGAHGGRVASAHVFDLAHGKNVDWDAELGDERTLLAERPAADAVESDDIDHFDDEAAARTELLPSFGDEGALHLGRQFTSPTCYACSDGAWSSYTHSIVVDTTSLPRALRAYAKPAPGLAAFVRAHPLLTVGGVSAFGD